MGATQSMASSSQSDENTANGTKSPSRSWNIEFVIAARPLGLKLFEKNSESLEVHAVNPESVGNVVGFQSGDRIVGVNECNFGDSRTLLKTLQRCKLPMTLQVHRPNENSDEESSTFSYSRSISCESSTSVCNLCAVCNQEETVLYVNPCYHDVCHACWEKFRGSKEDGPYKCPLCRFPAISTHPISHYHVPSQNVITKVRPFVEVHMKWPPAILGLVFEFLTFQYQPGDRVVVRDTDADILNWTEGVIADTNPLTVNAFGEKSRDWPEILPIDEPRPELFQPNRSTSFDWPWPRPLNSQVSTENSAANVYSRNCAPKWFRGRKYFRKLERLKTELYDQLPCRRASLTWSQSARSSLLLPSQNRNTSKSRRSMLSEVSSIVSSNNRSRRSVHSEVSSIMSSNNVFSKSRRSMHSEVSSIVSSNNDFTLSSFSYDFPETDPEDVEQLECKRMQQIVEFVHRLKARKS